MMRKIILLVICSVFTISVFSEVSVGSEVTVMSSYGIADDTQEVSSTQDGFYDELKNGQFVSGSISLKGSIENRFSLYIKLLTKSVTGSPYIPLTTASSSAENFSLSVSNIYGTLLISELLFRSDISTLLQFGKFSKSASDFSVSGFKLDSVTGVANLSNSLNTNLNTKYEFSDRSQYIYGTKANITLDVAAGAKFGEDIQVLYDVDGGISEHGKLVLGEYGPQIFVNLALNNYVLPTATLSFGVTYSINSKGFYTGNTIAASTLYTKKLVGNSLYLPVSLSLAITEKNIDIFTESASNTTDVDTTGFRETLQVSSSIGLQYIKKSMGIIGTPKIDGKITLSGSYKQINHIYRDQISVINLGLDGEYKITPKVFIGGGAILGTLTDVTWKTNSSSAALDNFNKTYTLDENYGYEIYAGLDFLSGARLLLGFTQKKGLSMGYNIEASNAGMVKYKQYGTELSEGSFETMGIFLKTTITL